MLLTSIVNIIFAMIIFARIVELHPIIGVYALVVPIVLWAVWFYWVMWVEFVDGIRRRDWKLALVVWINIMLMSIVYANVIAESMC